METSAAMKLIVFETLQTGIVAVSLNRPERRNALSIALLEQLVAAIERLQSERANRVVILRGTGPVFSSGLDLHEAADCSLVERSAAAVERALAVLQQTRLVVVAAVQGGAYAGGAGLVAACDIVVAAKDAKFGFPEARRGLLPALICPVLRHKVHEGDLRDLFLTGDAIDASRGQQVGLVQRVVPPNRLLDEALAVAKSILAGGPETIRQTKALLGGASATSGGPSPNFVESHLAARHGEEAREGLAAFTEKRKAAWQ